jgi:phosphatidate cytidylyltransferase
MKNMLLRTITGIGVVAAIVAAILWSPYAFLTIFCILTAGVLFEFYTLINVSKEVHITRLVHCTGGMLLFASTFLTSSHHTRDTIYLYFLAYMMTLFISLLYSKRSNPIRELAYVIIGLVYIAMPISMLNIVAFHTVTFTVNSPEDYSPIFLLALFMFIWIYDTGAYLTGMTFGKHKLFPRISPKKSWEGVYGGILFCILLGWGLSYDTFWNFIHINVHDGIRLSTLEWIGMGIVVAIFSTFGDLIESFVKRSVGVKDSGTILPGHGGLWDRFDSLLMATPALVIYLNVIKLF